MISIFFLDAHGAQSGMVCSLRVLVCPYEHPEMCFYPSVLLPAVSGSVNLYVVLGKVEGSMAV